MTEGVIYIVIAMVCAYLIGSFPSAYIVARLRKGIDIRDVGSRNMGAMNVFYKVGFVEGLMVLTLDIGKGAAAVALARWLGVPMIAELFAGVTVLIGHNFPVFLRFRGGRGGATLIGVLAFLLPWGIPFYLAIFGLGLLLTRNATFSYSIAFLCFPFIAWLWYHSLALVAFSAAILVFPLLRYIPRLKEMRAAGGSWRHVIRRRDFKDRL